MLEFRLLRADEIDVRIAQVGAWGVSLLLYKDARCDMNILDETVGAMNWQRYHSRDNANCTVAIWDEEKRLWIQKEDTGTESFTEREKGIASDSFKRACFNWGIGRELYTAPTMFVKPQNLKTLKQDNNKWTCKDSFKVTDIRYDNRKIKTVQIVNTKTGAVLDFGDYIEKPRAPKAENRNKKITVEQQTELIEACAKAPESMNLENALKACNRTKVEDVTEVQFYALMQRLESAA